MTIYPVSSIADLRDQILEAAKVRADRSGNPVGDRAAAEAAARAREQGRTPLGLPGERNARRSATVDNESESLVALYPSTDLARVAQDARAVIELEAVPAADVSSVRLNLRPVRSGEGEGGLANAAVAARTYGSVLRDYAAGGGARPGTLLNAVV